jgi:Ca2+-binding RTX toxin-like protein
VFTGTKANLNTVLDSIRYTTNSSVPTSEQITITITDAAGGVATKTLPINIGTSGALTGNSDSLLGSAGDDIFSGVLSDFVASDTLAGGTGTDKLTLTDIGTSGTLPTLTTKATGIDILDLVAVSSNGGSAVSTLAVFNAVDFGSTLMTVNFTAGNSSGTTAGDANDTLTATTANTGTVFNIQNTMGTLTVGGINGTPTATDAFTVNLAGGTAVTTIADGGTNVIDVLNINSNGTSANSVGFIDVDANTTINVAGSQALTISNTLPALAAIKFNAASATGKITVAAGESAASIIGGSAGDVITGGNGLDTISGGAGNDTINGGAAADLITGGTGADSLTGGAGFDTFVFAVGDSPATGRDTIADLAEGDIIKFGTALTGLTNGATLTTSSTNTIYVDNVNNRLVVGTDSINIPPSVANAAFTYSYGADSVVGTADDTITVGAAPFVATNNAGGVLTLTGKAISTVIVDMDNLGLAPKVNSAITGNNQVSKLDASLVTSSGVNVTGSARADTIIGSAENDTITGGAGSDIITGGAGGDSISFSESPTAVDTLVINAGDTWNGASVVDTVTVLTGIDKISGFASGDKIQLVAATGTSPVFNKGSLGVDNKWTNNSSGADSILIYDADGSGTGTNQDAIVLIGYTTGTNGAITGNTITLS